jgi:hypothetical protein
MAWIKETTRAKLMMLHGITMLTLGMLLFYVRDTILLFHAFGCALAMLLMAGSLVMLAVLDWICVAAQGAHQASKLRGLLFVSAGAAAIGVVLSLWPGATIRMFGYVVAVYALLLGFGKYQLARNWQGSQWVHRLMYVLAFVALLFGVALLVSAGWDEREVITLIAFYSLFTGAQIILSMFYLQGSLEPETPRAS